MVQAWSKLEASAARLSAQHLRELIDTDQRFESLSFRHEGMLMDLSRQRIDAQVMNELLELAEEKQLSSAINAPLLRPPKYASVSICTNSCWLTM